MYYAMCPGASWDLEFTRVRPSQLPCKVVVRGQSVVGLPCSRPVLSWGTAASWREHTAGSLGHVASCDMAHQLVTRANSAKHSQTSAMEGRAATVCLSVCLSVCGEDRDCIEICSAYNLCHCVSSSAGYHKQIFDLLSI